MGLIQQGSPPRGRGKAIQKGGVANGIEDHPRVGGEKADCPAGRAEVGGSPPRGRGKAGKPCSNDPEQGITPAWAGKRDGQHGPRYDYQDHPRVGGEKFTGGGFRAWARGSPPRGRGKVLAAGMLADGLGITPAWAGKSSRGGYARGRPRDHPRVGGEKKSILDVQPLKLGSPPRGRGKVRVMFESLTSTRITPAWAGKSCLCFICVLPSEDHPRVGGEKTKKIP